MPHGECHKEVNGRWVASPNRAPHDQIPSYRKRPHVFHLLTDSEYKISDFDVHVMWRATKVTIVLRSYLASGPADRCSCQKMSWQSGLEAERKCIMWVSGMVFPPCQIYILMTIRIGGMDGVCVCVCVCGCGWVGVGVGGWVGGCGCVHVCVCAMMYVCIGIYRQAIQNCVEWPVELCEIRVYSYSTQ